MIIIHIVKKIGMTTWSGQASTITFFVFVCQFFNTGILFLLSQANFTGQATPLDPFLQGKKSDFDQNWYSTTGEQIVGSMILNSYFSVVLEMAFMGLRKLKRYYDSSGVGRTRCTTVQQYIDLHSGPEYLVHFRFSFIMNIAFITMIYGPSLPLLFPTAFISFLIIYILEVYCLFYVYKKPVSYDAALYLAVLNQLQYASLISLAFSAWQFSNFELLPKIQGDQDGYCQQREMELRETVHSPFMA